MNVVDAAIYQRITATAAITSLLASATAVYNREAPAQATGPYVVFAKQTGADDNDNPHRARQLLYLIKGVVSDVIGTGASKTLKNAQTIDDAIDAAFHRQPMTVTGWTNFWLVRESDVSYQEDAPGGRRFYHAGGIYRVRIAV
jgi:hypothetical protein